MIANKILIEKLDLLIKELEQTNNPAKDYYRKVLERYKSISEKDVRNFLVSLHGSVKIKDMNAFNKSQSDAWDDMWSKVDSLLNDKQDN